MSDCPFCLDWESFPMELDSDGVCPVCGFYEEINLGVDEHDEM